jgi:hypothetical protein
MISGTYSSKSNLPFGTTFKASLTVYAVRLFYCKTYLHF